MKRCVLLLTNIANVDLQFAISQRERESVLLLQVQHENSFVLSLDLNDIRNILTNKNQDRKSSLRKDLSKILILRGKVQKPTSPNQSQKVALLRVKTIINF